MQGYLLIRTLVLTPISHTGHPLEGFSQMHLFSGINFFSLFISSLDYYSAPVVHVWRFGGSGLRHCVVVTSWSDLEDEHHCVILMHNVVTVERILALEVAETEEGLRLHVVFQPDHVFAPVLNQAG